MRSTLVTFFTCLMYSQDARPLLAGAACWQELVPEPALPPMSRNTAQNRPRAGKQHWGRGFVGALLLQLFGDADSGQEKFVGRESWSPDVAQMA